MEEYIALLDNGLRIVNFNSPHAFVFEDETVLPKVNNEITIETALNVREEVVSDFTPNHNKIFETIKVEFFLSGGTYERIEKLHKMWVEGQIDIVITPLPVMTALKKEWSYIDILNSPFRTGRLADRVLKILFVDKFCI